MIEAQFSSVGYNKVGRLLYAKGATAEDLFPRPGEYFWDTIEYVVDCHRNVECYRFLEK